MHIYRGKLSFGANAHSEAFTLIIPMQFKYNDPIFALWRWTTSPDGTSHALSCNATTIESIRIASRDVGTTTYVDFTTADKRYAFEGDFDGTDVPKNINLLMQDSTTSTSSNIKLNRHYSSDFSPLPTYRIYVGGFSYANLATDELMIIVFPSEPRKGAHACTYWQWTKSDNNSGDMANVNNKAIIKKESSSSSNPHELVLNYPAVHNRYGIETRVNADTNTLTMSIRPKDKSAATDGTGTNILLQRLLPLQTSPGTIVTSSADSEKARKKRDAGSDADSADASKTIGLNTSAILNDTKNAVYCILTESTDGKRSQNIALAGVAIAALGMLPFAMSGVAALIASVGVAGVGAELAIVGLMDAFVSNAGPVMNLLFEGDVLYRTSSSFVPLNADNDMTLFVISIENKTFTVKFATKQSLGEKTWKVSQFLKAAGGKEDGEGNDVEWSKLVHFKLPQDCKLKSFRLLRVPKFSVSLPGGKQVPLNQLEINHGTMFMKGGKDDGDDDDSVVLYDKLSLKGLKKGDEVLAFNSSKAFMLADGGGGHAGEDYVIMMPFQGHTYRLLLLQKCKISSMGRTYGFLGNPANEVAVLTQIQSEPGYLLYYWNKNLPNTQLRGLDTVALKGMKIVYSGDAADYVYVPVVEWSPYQKIVLDSGSKSGG